jgi:hypothetical protein
MTTKKNKEIKEQFIKVKELLDMLESTVGWTTVMLGTRVVKYNPNRCLAKASAGI